VVTRLEADEDGREDVFGEAVNRLTNALHLPLPPRQAKRAGAHDYSLAPA